MRGLRLIRFLITAALISAGCFAWVAHLYYVTLPCLILAPLILCRSMDYIRSSAYPNSQKSWFFYAILLVVIFAMDLCGWFASPRSPGRFIDRLIFDPIFVGALWVLFMSGLFLQWRKENYFDNHIAPRN